jgi:hypothetical protein
MLQRRIFTGLAMLSILLGSTLIAEAQINSQWNDRYWRRYSRNQVAQRIRNLEISTNEFRRDLDRWLDQSRFEASVREDRFNARVAAFEQATNQLRMDFDRTDSWWETRNDVQQVLVAARPVAQMMARQRFSREVEMEWRRLRNNTNTLARLYRLPQV